MGKSFVLRNERGDPVGYLTQGMHAINCRVREIETDEVVLFLQDGTHRRRRIERVGEEMQWKEEECAIEGAVALESGRISAATGEDARRKWSQMECRKRAREAKAEELIRTRSAGTEYTGQDEPKEEAESEKAERVTDTEVQNAHAWPQQRWPPPPCWKSAVYVHGAWDEEKA